MKEKVLNFLKSNLFFAFILNVAIMVICIAITSFSYDNINDFYNSLYICQYHYYYNNDINYLMANLIGSLQFILDGFNCYVLALVGFSFVAFTSISYVFAQKYNKIKSLIFTVIITILFALNHYAAVESHKTSAVLLVAGFLLVLNAIRDKRYNLPCWVGVTEIALGSFFSYEYFFIALGFAVAYFFADMIAKRKYKIAFRKFFWYFRPFLLMFVLIALIVVGLNQYSISVNNSSEESASYYEYSQLCDNINALPYPSYKSNKEELADVGITSENNYELLKNGYYDDNTMLDNTALKAIYDIQQRENSKNVFDEFCNIFIDASMNFAGFNTLAVVMVAYILAAVFYLVFQKKRFSFFPIFYIIEAMVGSVCIRYFFSGATYLIYGIWLIMFVMLFNSFDFEHQRPRKGKIAFSSKKSNIVAALVVVAVLISGYGTSYLLHYKAVDTSKRPSSLMLEISRHPERYYVFDPGTLSDYIKTTDNYIHPLWGFKSSYLSNIDSFGYFHKVDQLRSRNLSDNIYEAVLDGNNIFVIDNSITFKKENYFTSYYTDMYSNAEYNQYDEIDGYKIYQIASVE